MRHQLYWTPQKIASRLALIRPLVHKRKLPLAPFRYKRLAGPGVTPPVAPEFDDSAWEEILPSSYWGGWSIDFALRTRFTIPVEFGPGPVALHLPFGTAGDIFNHPEALLHIDGAPLASADRYHHEIVLPATLRDGREHTLALQGWTGLSGWPPDPEAKNKLYMSQCHIVLIDEPTRDFLTLADIALQVAEEMGEDAPEKRRVLNALDAAILALDTRDPIGEAFYQSVPTALAGLKQWLAATGAPLDVDIIAIGHAHIDIAYLWQVAQARLKNQRTTANVLHLMERYPDYRYSQSQAQLYRFLEDDAPEVFAQVQDRVAEGRWEIIGGMWVEADCNIPGAESLVRQLLLGRRYIREKFGAVDTPVLWLPDTFGFPWSMPQLMKQAGLRWFVTNKVSWNQYNPAGAQILWWQGIDGTKVLAHFLTTPRAVQYLPYPTTYKAEMTAEEVFGTWRNFRQKERPDALLMAYGYGDGGGGPTMQLIENARTLKAMPGTPRVTMGTVRDFFERLEDSVLDRLPVWNDEFYLELHRGVLTSQAGTKRANRRCETLLHDAEAFSAMATATAGAPYPHGPLTRAWEALCLQQFHDILPGTTIPEVIADAAEDHAQIKALAHVAIRGAADALAKAMPAETEWLVLNAAPFKRPRSVFVAGEGPHSFRRLDTGAAVPCQSVEGGTLVALDALPPYSATPLAEAEHPALAAGSLLAVAEGDGFRLENALLRLRFDAAGRLLALTDLEAGREVLKPGEVGNQLQLFEDRPLNWDAWDIDAFFEDRMALIETAETVEIVEAGPVRASLKILRRFRASTLTQHVRLYAGSKRIDFATELDWHESHALLKVAFPVAILAPSATFDIQWGAIERPTHRNSPRDFARFEVGAQKWADLSEGDYGVALLNDCKYGYDIRDDVMRLSLVKSATMPDPSADQGRHVFTYALLPHLGDWRGEVRAAAADLNDPIHLIQVEGGSGRRSGLKLVESRSRNAVIETVKWAEDGDGFIVRLYEAERRRGTVRLQFGIDVESVTPCNLLEEATAASVTLDGRNHIFALSPFEIVSLRCRLPG